MIEPRKFLGIELPQFTENPQEGVLVWSYDIYTCSVCGWQIFISGSQQFEAEMGVVLHALFCGPRSVAIILPGELAPGVPCAHPRKQAMNNLEIDGMDGPGEWCPDCNTTDRKL